MLPSRMSKSVRIIATGMTPLNKLKRASPADLMQSALFSALESTGLKVSHLDGLIAVPSLADPHFMVISFLWDHREN